MSLDPHHHSTSPGSGGAGEPAVGRSAESEPLALPSPSLHGQPARRRRPVSVPVPTTQRRSVLAALAENPAFVSAQALHAQLLASGHRVGLTTVYRALHTYVGTGDIDTARAADATELFRHRPEPGQSGTGHHHYLRCRACGYSVPIHSDTVETWTGVVGERHDFTDLTHTVEVLGVCAPCRSDTPVRLPVPQPVPQTTTEIRPPLPR